MTKIFNDLAAIAATAVASARRGDEDGTDVAMAVSGRTDGAAIGSMHRIAILAAETERRGDEDGTQVLMAMRDAHTAIGRGFLA